MSETMSFEEFRLTYHCEEACLETLCAIKWPDGYCCPRCAHQSAYIIRTRRLPLFECRACHHQASLISSTVMEGSKTPLHKWFQAIYLVASPSININATYLAELIQVTYKTAWLILHKLRNAISQADSLEILKGSVRVNAALYGKPYNPYHLSHPQEHPLLSGASIDAQGNIAYVKIKQVPKSHISQTTILRSGIDDFVQTNVDPKTEDVTIVKLRYPKFSFKPLYDLCKNANLRINETFHGIGGKHLQAYLDEYCFLINFSNKDRSTLDQLMRICTILPPITYKSLIHRGFTEPRRTTTLSAA
ncbi:transposase [Paenibacillus mendelii]|uniref:Transposase n=1 Tax=Paenibacillus mendelii TaxID=206163 RepID=A0ABV6JJA1_9BACL|nr:transposase [Paenibacillus mendelii]MCQ6558919.1 transposase [Paenibacillus mendelii]